MNVNKKLKLRVVAGARLGMNRQIADQIHRKISSGELQVADRLPSEQNLASELKVSRDVVRRAYHILKESGLIDSPRRQSGWQVTSNSSNPTKS